MQDNTINNISQQQLNDLFDRTLAFHVVGEIEDNLLLLTFLAEKGKVGDFSREGMSRLGLTFCACGRCSRVLTALLRCCEAHYQDGYWNS